MKQFYVVLMLLVAMPGMAYQAGPSSRANFSNGKNAQQEEPATADKTDGKPQTRSFTSYGARQGAWRQQVQTQPVQTQTAGSDVKDFTATVATAGSAAQKQKAGAAPAAAAAGSSTANKPQQPTAAQQQSAQPAATDPAAMMQQVQGMMSALGGMMGGGAQQNQGQKGGSAPAANAAMPDMSALMNAAMGGQAPQPAKK